jgi:ATP-binding cassette subfamily B protein
MVSTANIHSLNLEWNKEPLSLLTDEQKTQLVDQSCVSRHIRGEVIWSSNSHDYQLLVVGGKLRAIQEPGKSILEPGKKLVLGPGTWFGGLLGLVGNWRVRVMSQEAVVIFWKVEDWQAHTFTSPMLPEYWERLRWQYQPFDPKLPHPAPEYPHILHPNTGAACLSLATQALKSPIPVDKVQLQLRGQTPRDLAEGAEKLGLLLQHVQSSWEEISRLPFPALLQWDQQYWVFAYEKSGERLLIADPTNSRKTAESVPKDIVEKAWDGQLWLVDSLPEAEKFNLKWFLPAIWRFRRLLGEVLAASLTLQLLGLASPMITQVIIDKVIVHGSLSTLDVMAIALLCVAIFESGLGMLRLYTFTHTTRRLDLSLSAQVFYHLLQLPLAYFESRRVGDTIARVQELENIRQFLTGTALTVILDGIFVVVYLALMLFYSGKLTLVSLVVIPFFVVLIWKITPTLRDWLNESFNRRADSQAFLVETVSGIHAVKAHTAELPARERWEGLFARYVNQSFRADTLSNVNSHLGDFLTQLSELLILWFGARLVIEHHLTVGQLVAFQMLSGRAIGPLLRLSQLWQNFQQVLLSVDRIGDILNATPEADIEAGLVLRSLQGRIKFENVVFRYLPHLNEEEKQYFHHQPLPEPALKGISFTIEPGKFVGIVGRSGSGKSTLSKLIQRLYQPEKGRILLDGFDIKGTNLPSLRQQIGVVLQDDFLFNGTVFENITFNQSDISLEQGMEAAELAAAHEFISELPHGYQTHIGERGTGLSGGQRQRITLARLFLSKAPILILDEATSALDSETEQRILKNLRSVSQDRTMLMIAHRFAPLKNADLILVLEKGELVEMGRHKELLQQEGLYWTLYQKQQTTL